MGARELASCGCCSLKTGTIIIGVFQSVLCFMLFILSAAYSVHTDELVQMNDPSVIPKMETLKTILIIVAVTSALQCGFAILLIFGAASNRPALFTPWLILKTVCLFNFLVANLVAMFNYKGSNTAPFIVGHILSGVIVTVLVSYQILVVYSYRKHLKRLNF